jgi:uncharacterized protein YxjI
LATAAAGTVAPPTLGNTFVVKEHTGIFKAANNFDIFDPATGALALTCREPKLGLFTKLLRFTDYKRMTPFDIEVRSASGDLVVRVTRGVSIFVSTVRVEDGQGRLLGSFKQKFFSLGGAFDVRDAREQVVCSLKGKWTGWEFRFVQGERELAKVSKQWAGLGRELFTSADNYVLDIAPWVRADDPVRRLILASVLCIDMVLKE